ncbi:MAG: hypothetical protein ACKO1M_11460 [Planctomycetota bacterium]
MHGSDARATLVICGTVPRTTRSEPSGLLRGPGLPVTWLAPIDRLVVAAALADCHDGCAAALELPPAALESRSRLRGVLARGRDVLPGLAAVAVIGTVTAEHRGLLVEEGIRVALVDKLAEISRGSRRPAPSGWRCRNAAWGLWEVETSAGLPHSPLAWLGLGGRPRPAGLHVLRTEALAKGNGGTVFLASRLERQLAWARRQVDLGRAVAVSVDGLATRLSGGEQAARDHSILRAA